MAFKKFLNTAAALIFAYTLGELAGNIRCFNKLTDKYKDVLFEKDTVVTYEISKACTICKTKPKEEGDK